MKLITIAIGWRTESGTGSTELTFNVVDYHEAIKFARHYFAVKFAPFGYTLSYVSIA